MINGDNFEVILETEASFCPECKTMLKVEKEISELGKIKFIATCDGCGYQEMEKK